MNTLGTAFAFHSSEAPRTLDTPPPGGPTPPLPDREWGLSAGQVVAVVLAIVMGCELLGLLL